MDFKHKSQREIEPELSKMGYIFEKEIDISGFTFLCNYINPEKKKRLQISYELFSHNAFCREVYETDTEA